VRAWAMAVATSGGMAVISDDLRALDDRSAGLLGDVLEMGRISDAAAMQGNAARCDDLMVSSTPMTLTTVGARLEGDPERGVARVVTTGG
jgi:hypothetical protein